jgi:flagellar basal body-associated protein FliL
VSKKTVVIVASALAVLAGAGGVAFRYWRSVAPPAHAEQPSALVEVGAITVRLADRGEQNEHYLKATPVLEVCCGRGDKVSHDLVYVRDRFVVDAGLYTSQDLMSASGVGKLKSMLAGDLNQRFGGAVKGVLFNELVVE